MSTSDVCDASAGHGGDKVRYLCHVYDRGTDVPHIGSFIGESPESVLSAVYDAIFECKGTFTDLQRAEAEEAWLRGERYYELDEDGFSLAFMRVTERGLE